LSSKASIRETSRISGLFSQPLFQSLLIARQSIFRRLQVAAKCHSKTGADHGWWSVPVMSLAT
jgi:hypothetical protein